MREQSVPAARTNVLACTILAMQIPSRMRKLEQQRKAPKHDEASRPAQYGESSPQQNYPKQVHNIDYDGYGPPENFKKNFGPPLQERKERAFDYRSNHYSQGGGMSDQG
jgi:hypothetical protein